MFIFVIVIIIILNLSLYHIIIVLFCSVLYFIYNIIKIIIARKASLLLVQMEPAVFMYICMYEFMYVYMYVCIYPVDVYGNPRYAQT